MLLTEPVFTSGNMSSYPNVLTPPSSNEDSPRPTYFEASPGSSIFTSPAEQLAPLSPYGIQATVLGTQFNKPDADMPPSPELRFVEQPTDKFRFRYRSEMAGTHGSLTGFFSDRSRKSTYPTVELLNYDRPAIIRCSIYQMSGIGKDEYMPHAHRLILKRGKEELDDPHNIPVGPQDGYTAQFHSMGIIHTAKKNLVNELMKKKAQLYKERVARLEGRQELNVRELVEIRGSAEQESKSINLNIVCLRFDAFMVNGDIWYPICDPIYSHGINNLKSPLTGELKIVRIDHCTSPAKGDKEVFVLVERVTKKNVKIRFFELNDDDQEVWEGYGKFTDLDVHHQYAIVFKTPKYRDENITRQVKVYMELIRPSDNARSDPKEFTYVPNHDRRGGKRPRMSNYTSSGSWSSSNFGSELPEPVNNLNLNLKVVDNNAAPLDFGTAPNSSDLTKALENINSDEFNQLFNDFGDDYLSNLDLPHDMSHSVDTAQKKSFQIAYPEMDLGERWSPKVKNIKNVTSKMSHLNIQANKASIKRELDPEDIMKAERAYSELKSFIKTTHTQERAVKFLDYYLGNENQTNALHIFICLNRHDEVTFLMKMIFMTQHLKLVNIKDSNDCTPLHLAVAEKNSTFVKFLLRCKSDCSLGDSKGNTALHLAVEEGVSNDILEMVASGTLDLNTTNYDGNTALFIAVERKNVPAIRILYRHQADINKQHPKNGYTALRFAIEKQYLDVIKFLLSLPNLDPGVGDFKDVTPFGAAARKECSKEILEAIQTYMKENNIEIQVKEEYDDDDDDEDMDDTDTDAEVKSEPASLDEIENLLKDKNFTPNCLKEVSDILNKSGNWRHLADLLGLDHLLVSGMIPAKGNISENLLIHATEVHNDSVYQIRNFLENLEEREAVEAIDKMARSCT